MVLRIIRAEILLIARIFPRPFRAGKILRNLQHIRAYYTWPSNIYDGWALYIVLYEA